MTIGSAQKGVIAAARKEAIDIGDETFAAGGNAVDAAVAAAFALGVSEPYMGGIGAVGEIVVGLPDGRIHVIDCAARAPRAARSAMFQIVGEPTGLYAWPAVRDNANIHGARAVAAPRLVHGLETLHRRFGRIAWRDVVMPAANLARRGVAADHFTAAILLHEQATLSRDPLARTLYYAAGAALCAPIDGNPAIVRNDALADALQLLAAEGARPMAADGDIGRAIIETIRAGGGLIGPTDLGPHEEGLFENVQASLDFAGWALYGSPLPSGAMTVSDILRHLPAEGVGGSASEPDRYVGFARAALAGFARRLTQFSGAGAAFPTPTATTHLSVAGADGTVVGITQTLLSLFGAQVGVESHGFFLNNGMMWFDPVPGRPNSIAGGARALMAVSPMIAIERRGARRFVIGALGGRRIITAVSQILENRLRFGDTPQMAVNRPRIHADGVGPVLVDHRLPSAVREALMAVGRVEPVYYGPTTLNSARAFMAEVNVADGSLAVGVDQRAMSVWDLSGGMFDE